MHCKLGAIPGNLVAQRFLKWAKCPGQFAQCFSRTDAPFEMAGAYTFQCNKRRPMPNLRDRLHEPGIDQRYKVWKGLSGHRLSGACGARINTSARSRKSPVRTEIKAIRDYVRDAG